MPPPTSSRPDREDALQALVASAVANIPGVDLASITLNEEDDSLRTLAASDVLAERADAIQYELREGPCYDVVTRRRWVRVDDLSRDETYPRFGPRMTEIGIRSQAAIQLVSGERRAGLNMYAHEPGAFDRSSIQFAELYASQAAVALEFAEQVEQLSEALRSRTDIGTAVGIVMERYRLDRHQAFGYLVRVSNTRNVKMRALALELVGGTHEENA